MGCVHCAKISNKIALHFETQQTNIDLIERKKSYLNGLLGTKVWSFFSTVCIDEKILKYSSHKSCVDLDVLLKIVNP